MPNLIYDAFKVSRLRGNGVNLLSDLLKVALVTSDYVPSAGHVFFSDITNEVVGGGYDAGGKTVSTKSITGTAPVVFSAGVINWPLSNITARGAVLYKSTGDPSTSNLVKYIDFGSDLTSIDNNFTLDLSPVGGILFLDLAV